LDQDKVNAADRTIPSDPLTLSVRVVLFVISKANWPISFGMTLDPGEMSKLEAVTSPNSESELSICLVTELDPSFDIPFTIVYK